MIMKYIHSNLAWILLSIIVCTTGMCSEIERTHSCLLLNCLYTITSNIERISDHAINIAEYSNMIEEKQIVFSKFAQAEIMEMQKVCDQMFEVLLNKQEDVIEWHEHMAAMEQKIDDLTEQYRNNMYDRIQSGVCSDKGSILFSEMLTDFERIGDHALNISNQMLKIAMTEK